MNKKQKIIAFVLLTWLLTANVVVFADEALPDMSSPFDSPASGTSDSSSDAPPSLNKKDSSSETPPSLNKKTETPVVETEVPKVDEPVESVVKDDSKPDKKVVSAAKVKAKYSDLPSDGQVMVDGATYVSPKPKKVVKSGPEAAILILPSLVLGYFYNRKRK